MISQSRYVKIVSGVGAGTTVRTRTLALRLITEDVRVAANEVVRLTSADEALKRFGDQSEIYRRAAKYFAFVSKSITAPSVMSVVRWINQAVAPMVRGASPAPLSSMKAVVAGTLQFYKDGVKSEKISAIDLSAATSENSVAQILTGKTAALVDPVLKASAFAWDATQGKYTWTGSQATEVTFTFQPETVDPNDLCNLLGFASDLTVVSPGQNQESLVDAISRTTEEDNDFGTFIIADSANASFHDKLAVAKWNAAQNNMFMFLLGVDKAFVDNTAPDQLFEEFKGIAGCGCVLRGPRAMDYTDQIPAEILASINYGARNGTQNFMFYPAGDRAAAVTTNKDADKYDPLRVNYIGMTQTAGQKLAFFQRGTLQGSGVDASDMNVYSNEIWMKDFIASEFMTLFLAMPDVPADEEGMNMGVSILQNAAERGKFNGVITIGKEITTVQRLYIAQITGDDMAWHQIFTSGYWFTVDVKSQTTIDGRTEYVLEYLFLYSKGDSIRAVEGRDVMI